MFLRLVFPAILLQVNYVGCDECPTPAEMGPCDCSNGGFGLLVNCSGGMVDKIRHALAKIASKKTFHLTLEDVWLPNVPSNFLLIRNVILLTIRNSSTSSVDDDAFVDVAAKLRVITLTHSALERVPSQSLKKCYTLTNLDLSNNRIDILHAEAFSGLVSLNILTLMENRIKFIDDSAFVGIGRRFTFLKLGGNELTAVPCTALSKLKSLVYLYLEGNKISFLSPEEIDAMGVVFLRQFVVANNTIRHLPGSMFKSMRQLYYVDLSGNAMETIHPSAFEGTESTLQYLNLNYNRLKEVPSEAFKNMRGLESVYLKGNKICKIRKDEFLAYGKRITYIDLQNNSLEYLDTKAFNGLHSLVNMLLGSNHLTSFPFETFSPVYGTLRRFDIHDNPFHCDCNIRWLKKQESWIADMSNGTNCATPERYANVSLTEIPIDELVCDDNETSLNPPEPCCSCFVNSQQRISSTVLMSILQISFTYLLTTVVRKQPF